jgi:hypothetical protein
LLYLLRWFWWRINAWCEVVAMVSSFAASVTLLALHKRQAIDFSTHEDLLITVAVTTLCWVAAAYMAPQTDQNTLINFYRKVHPFGPGWRRIRIAAGISDLQAAEYARHENIPLALLGWSSGCAVIWSSLFTVGNFLYGRNGYAALLLVVFLASGAVLIGVIKRLWK